MSIASDISDLKDLSDGVVANKVSRFAYTEQAYTDNEVNGVIDYDVNRGRNIPVGTASVMKVNQTVIEKGWRARASSITRMLMNHFLGRISYNLNKVNDWFNSFLGSMSSYLGAPNGIATLDNNGYVVQQGNMTKTFLGAVFGSLLGREWIPSDLTYLPEDVTYANGIFVCGSQTHGVWWSESGKNWYQGTGISSSITVVELHYYANIWVTVDRSSHSNNVWWSADGKNWYQGEGSNSYYFSDVTYANGLWLCKAWDYNPSVSTGRGLWWSEDGKSWTQCTGDLSSRQVGIPKFANGLWVSVGNGTWWSEDGKSWTHGTGLSNPLMGSNVYANGLWVCGSSGNGMWWSEDGKSWTQGTGNLSSIQVGSGLRFTGSVWVCGSLSNGCWRSADGKAWSQGNGNTNVNISIVAYANGVLIAGHRTENSGVWYSTDLGANWSQATGIDNVSISYPNYINGTWFCQKNGSASDAYLHISTDGKNWSKVYYPMTLHGDVICVKGTLYAGGTRGMLYSSIDTLIEKGFINLGKVTLIDA